MSNTEIDPAEYECRHVGCADVVDVITAREVPLGGPRAMTVRRTLPQRKRSLIGPWCFVDHFGPDDVSRTGGMNVPRHPHTGLATVSLLFSGEIDHIDSSDFANTVRPAEVNLMIAGSGISHSEHSTQETSTLHGVQLWYALPDDLRNGAPGSQHHIAHSVRIGDADIRTYLGTFAGQTSPVDTRVPATAAEVVLPAGGSVAVDLDPEHEYGVLVDSGTLRVRVGDHAQTVAKDELAYLPAGPGSLVLEAVADAAPPGTDAPVRLIVIGGRPFGEKIVMWWNFVGRTHDEIASYRAAWQAEIGRPEEISPTEPDEFSEATATGRYPDGTALPRFGDFPAGTPAPLSAPALPNVRIRPREG